MTALKGLGSKYVVVTGPLGSGASTLAKLLHRRLGWMLLEEGEIDRHNAFFADALSDFRRWGFQNQVDFLTTSAERHIDLASTFSSWTKTEPLVVVEDRTPFEHTGVYLRAHAASERISLRETQLLERLTEVLERLYLAPDLLVVRQARPKQLLDRVHSRRRAGEDGIDEGFVESVIEAYEQFVAGWTKSPILLIGDDVDVLDPHQADVTIDSIEAALAKE